jgi:hypothetical protein
LLDSPTLAHNVLKLTMFRPIFCEVAEVLTNLLHSHPGV